MDETNEMMTFQVESSQSGERVDRWLTSACPDLSRSAIRKLIDSSDVLVDGRSVKSSHRISADEQVTVRIPDPEPLDLVAENIPLDIRYEDDRLIVVNKPLGMVVHPAGPLRSGTLVNALLGHASLSRVNGDLRPGIVHRLDKDTSGLLVVAKDDVTHRCLAAQLDAREISRQYLAVCWGHPAENESTIETMINRSRRDRTRMAVSKEGRRAVTHVKVDARYDFVSRLSVTLETGRTHQIRVHLDHVGHPVFGDPVYNGREKRLKGISPLYRADAAQLLKSVDRQMLHAEHLAFRHPNDEEMAFRCEPPEDMRLLLERLEAAA
jgi:23S rRNA pseudouridine1911/1915/1917 synthase